MAMPAKNIEESTHRYPTSVLWGPNYFGDGYKYIIASSDADATEYVSDLISEHSLQRKINSNGWDYVI